MTSAYSPLNNHMIEHQTPTFNLRIKGRSKNRNAHDECTCSYMYVWKKRTRQTGILEMELGSTSSGTT
ncbi:hypothetical protein L915_08798 [Phytophthora nicotianae]|uniref:Uncharacterized protein n=2 Tax=Phytophthora nicotianae TaxID=4792 RepID=W2GUC5_PHYNI|nr:hypothetical protein L915_08798 [Phytophthora nicotianae]ETO75337.1 hypothetical protein F444_09041 [Phytophthora nicotianae P1976]